MDPRQTERFRGAVAACTSAERLCETAVRHGMLGHLHRLIGRLDGGAIDVAVADRLGSLHRASAEKNLRQTAQLLRLLERFDALGIEAMPIKGPAWGERLYGDPTLRNSIDLDLLVPYEHVAQVRQELLASGFEDGVWFNERLLRPEWRVWGEMPFVMPGADRMVDVHWRMTVGQGGAGIAAEEVIARSQPLTLLGREVRTPSDADLLLITCLHGTRHRWDGVEMLLSLAVQVRDLAGEAWPGIMAAAREAGCARRVTIAVAHVCRVFGLELPQEVAAALRRDPVARAGCCASLTPATLMPPRRARRGDRPRRTCSGPWRPRTAPGRA